jgi:cytoskeletal protein CcmA (bactofilin family)
VFKRRKPEEPPPAAAPAPVPLVPPTTQAEPAGAARPADSGLGVPPFRPAPPKEAPPMSRPPFPAAPQPPGAQPGQVPGGARPAAPQRQAAERRTMVIGRGISVHGTIQDAERLVVEGIVEAKMIQANELAIAQGGMFRGEVEVEEAEIAGTIDGTLTCHTALIVRSTGRVLGTARCRRLQVEDGGQISGQIEMITEPRGNRPAAPLSEAAKPSEG